MGRSLWSILKSPITSKEIFVDVVWRESEIVWIWFKIVVRFCSVAFLPSRLEGK